MTAGTGSFTCHWQRSEVIEMDAVPRTRLLRSKRYPIAWLAIIGGRAAGATSPWAVTKHWPRWHAQ